MNENLDPHGKPWATGEEISNARPATEWNPPPVNNYEKACQRFERINRDLRGIIETAEKMIEDAHTEWDAAINDLAQYEKMPGIPKDEYDELKNHS